MDGLYYCSLGWNELSMTLFDYKDFFSFCTAPCWWLFEFLVKYLEIFITTPNTKRANAKILTNWFFLLVSKIHRSLHEILFKWRPAKQPELFTHASFYLLSNIPNLSSKDESFWLRYVLVITSAYDWNDLFPAESCVCAGCWCFLGQRRWFVCQSVARRSCWFWAYEYMLFPLWLQMLCVIMPLIVLLLAQSRHSDSLKNVFIPLSSLKMSEHFYSSQHIELLFFSKVGTRQG